MEGRLLWGVGYSAENQGEWQGEVCREASREYNGKLPKESWGMSVCVSGKEGGGGPWRGGVRQPLVLHRPKGCLCVRESVVCVSYACVSHVCVSRVFVREGHVCESHVCVRESHVCESNRRCCTGQCVACV